MISKTSEGENEKEIRMSCQFRLSDAEALFRYLLNIIFRFQISVY